MRAAQKVTLLVAAVRLHGEPQMVAQYSGFVTTDCGQNLLLLCSDMYFSLTCHKMTYLKHQYR